METDKQLPQIQEEVLQKMLELKMPVTLELLQDQLPWIESMDSILTAMLSRHIVDCCTVEFSCKHGVSSSGSDEKDRIQTFYYLTGSTALQDIGYPDYEIDSLNDEGMVVNQVEMTTRVLGTEIFTESIVAERYCMEADLKDLRRTRDKLVAHLWELNDIANKSSISTKSTSQRKPMHFQHKPVDAQQQILQLDEMKRNQTRSRNELRHALHLMASLLAEKQGVSMAEVIQKWT